MAGRSLTLTEAADELGVHYMTVYRYVRTGRLPATRVGGAWQVASDDLDLVRRAGPGGRQRHQAGAVALPRQLESRLVAGDESGAWTLIESSLASHMKPDDLLLDVIGPSLSSIGTRWERGELSIADEHQASAVAIRLVSRLGARFVRRGVKRGTVVLAAPSGERHAAPIAMAANLLRWRGFDVVELGADTPGEAIAEALVGAPDVIAVAMACTVDGTGRSVRRTIAEVRRVSPDVPVLLGGAAIADADHARRLGATEFTGQRADEVVRAVEAIVARPH